MLMQTGLGNWHPLFFTNELHLKITIHVCEKNVRRKMFFFFCYFFRGGCQYGLIQTGLCNWHPFFNYYITNESHLKNFCIINICK